LERRLFKAVAKLVGFGIFVNSAGLSLLSWSICFFFGPWCSHSLLLFIFHLILTWVRLGFLIYFAFSLFPFSFASGLHSSHVDPSRMHSFSLPRSRYSGTSSYGLRQNHGLWITYCT
jgi:hypothetical protein